MLEGVEKKTIQTSRLLLSYLTAGNSQKQPLLLIHGNVSSNLFWDETVKALEKDYWIIAPDLRGYGETELKAIDATRGLRDWSDDVKSFVKALGINQPLHMMGWSLGGGVVMQYAIDYASDVKSAILVNPISPFGFGGTKDETGSPCYPNYAGSGGGTANPQFVEGLKNNDRGSENPNSPRNVMNQFYFKAPFRVTEEREEMFITSMLSTKTGTGFYPGNFATCDEWPGVIPGKDGINNAMSPQYVDWSAVTNIDHKFPILWIRGENDMIVSDNSFLDFGFLGQQGFVEGWPGEELYPPQPMVAQTKYVLAKYEENGGNIQEVVIHDAGHSPHIEKPEIFHETIIKFLSSNG